MTTAVEGGEWTAARPGCTLHPGKTRYPFHRRLGGPHGRSGRAENLVPTGIRYRTVQPIVNRTKMSTRNISWREKGGRYVGLTPGTLGACTVQGLFYLCLKVMRHKICVYSRKLIRFYVSCFQLDCSSQLFIIIG